MVLTARGATLAMRRVLVESSGPSLTMFNVWDPNDVNPYGCEMVRLIRQTGHRVAIWRPRGTATVPDVPTVRRLARSRAADGLALNVVLRATIPLLFALSSVLHRRPVWLMWTRGTYETAVFAFVAVFWPVIFVHHNPVPSRMGRATQRRGYLRLMRFARCTVIHSDRFSDDVGRLARSVERLPHPPYSAWTESHRPPCNERDTGNARSRNVLFLGQLRADKGSSELPEILLELRRRRISVTVASFGSEAVELSQKFRGYPGINFHVQSEPLPEEAIAQALYSSVLLIAPYTNATQSGTINLAFTVGLDTIAYDSGALAELLTPNSLTPADPVEFAYRVEQWMERPWPTYRHSPGRVASEVLGGIARIASRVTQGH